MHLALQQAELAAAAGDLPVGAVLVRGDTVIATGYNRNQATGEPTGHAELEAMRAAGSHEGDWRLTGTTLYVTLEPCPMCFGAVLQTRIERVVYGAANPRQGAVGGVMDLRVGPWKRLPVVDGGVLEARCSRLLSSFFAARR
jgi:tRNA(Arg) A34 adenosine deaminase TadA